jgi:hypothetical protein
LNARIALVVVSVLVVLVVATRDEVGGASLSGVAACSPARVTYTRYPGGDERLATLPWVRGEPRTVGLVGLLWYWPESWQRNRLSSARIFTGGMAPAGYSTKILWAFLAPSAKGRGGSRLLVRGRRLDGRGSFRQEFAAISYEGQRGAPSYASIINVPNPGCWRLQLSTGGLRASVVFRAVRAAEQPQLCTAGEVETLVRRFIDAFNSGDLSALDQIFAHEPEFEWYSTDAPGERFTSLAKDRPSLVPYFAGRHALGEQLTLRSFRFNGNTAARSPYGNFEYGLTRSALDLEATPYYGKGAAFCYRNRADVIFAWSMGRE